MFPRAVAMAVKGHHFMTVTRDLLATDALGALLHARTQALAGDLGVLPESALHRRRIMRGIVRVRAEMGRRYQRISAAGRERLAQIYGQFLQACHLSLAQLGLEPV
jgi:hypothetical protein